MKINIIADGNITTTSLLKQIFITFNGIDEINILYLDKIKLTQLTDSINIFCRCSLPYHGWISEHMIVHNIPYVFYIDDNLWELKGSSLLAQYHSSPQVLESLNLFVKNASIVITSTPKLKKYIVNNKYARSNNVIDLPNFVDFNIFDNIHKLSTEKKSCFRIGYAGSEKQEAFTPVLAALKELRSDGYKFELEFVGFKPKTDIQINNFFEHNESYLEYVKLVKEREWDLALAPFLDDYFFSFKTDNKYREYSALKIPAIFSNLEPYNDVITDGVNGFLADNTIDSWKNKIRNAIDGNVNLSVISESSYLDVKFKYNIESVSYIWQKSLNKSEFIYSSSNFKSQALTLSTCRKHIYYKKLISKFHWEYKKKFIPSYCMFLITIFNISVKQEGIRKSIKKTIRFLFRGLK